MNDYLGTGTAQQHCACNTPAGTSQASGGYNAGISQGGTLPAGVNNTLSPGLIPMQPGSTTLDSLQFLNGYLRTQIGQNVTVEFLFGTGTLTDRTGTLTGVGANYIIIRELGTNNLLVCDFFSIKLVRIYQST